jgi:hypothetical protein
MYKPRSNPALIVIVLIAFGFNSSRACDESLVSEHEMDIAQKLGANGPTETHGIESSIVLGSIVLGEDFDALKGRSLRAREITLQPGGCGWRSSTHRKTRSPVYA